MAFVKVAVPATTANLGPGFDCLGAALTLYNRFEFAIAPEDASNSQIEVTGPESDRISSDPNRNLAYQAFQYFYCKVDRAVPVTQIRIQLGFPLARGLGSSATAIVGGLVGANALAGDLLDRAALMQLAIELEGHPDNVVPALLGRCCLSFQRDGAIAPEALQASTSSQASTSWDVCEVPWSNELVPVLAIPNFELSTEEARKVLPTTYSRTDAIFNAARVGLLVRGLETGRGEWLRAALQDRIHQPYRQRLIAGYQAVRSAALQAGAYGVVISGAGPSILALTDGARSQAVAQAMESTWQAAGCEVQVLRLAIDQAGTVVEHS